LGQLDAIRELLEKELRTKAKSMQLHQYKMMQISTVTITYKFLKETQRKILRLNKTPPF